MFLFIPSLLIANQYEEPMSIYKSNYFISGDKEDQVKFQLSIKYNLVYPSKLGIYAGYTQLAWWKLYDKSSPFDEFNHEPELFLLFKNNDNFLNYNMGIIDYIQISPICHKSNGESGDLSRNINTYYSKIQISYGKRYNVGTNLTFHQYYSKAKQNKDIQDYSGYYSHEVFFQVRSRSVNFFDKEKIYFKHGMNFEKRKGWLETGIKLRIITSKIQPYFLFQVFHGYGESMIYYNVKDTRIRLGFTFE